MICDIIQVATQFNNWQWLGIHFYYTVKVHALFSCTLTVVEKNCVAAIGAVHFSVRSFGCALFVYDTGGKT